MFTMKAKRSNPEKVFGDSLMKQWAMHTGGWFYRIPDARHMRGGTPYSHPRPADYLITCEKFTALVETKWIERAKTVIPWNALTKSQRDTIESTRGTSMRYYVVMGTTLGAFVFDGHDRLCMNKRYAWLEICPVSWFPAAGCPASEMVADMLQ